MQLQIDNVAVALLAVFSASLAIYNLSAENGAGIHTILLLFTIESSDPTTGQDRNFYVGPVAGSNSGLWPASMFASHGVRGFNEPGDISPTSMSAMAATGANVVRAFVNLNRVPNTNTYTSDLSGVDSIVSSAAQLGFKVIIVFEPLPNQTAEEFWTDTSLQASIASNWMAVATRYKGNPTVAAYDLINEPVAPGGQAQWMSFATELINSIRSIDPAHVIIYEPSPGAIPESFSSMNTLLPFDNIVYSVHPYEPYQITHQGILYPTSITYPGPSTSYIVLANQLAPVRRFVADFHVPLLVGEFSCVRWAPSSSANNYVSDSITLF